MTGKLFSIKEEETNNKRYKVVKFAGIKFKFRKPNTKFNTVHYMVAMLKAYEIRNIVISPGTQNSLFISIVQNDDFFKCYSVVDERSAAYVATGIAYETNGPVVITCTGATASRNYLSALTEAYYRKLPIIALTFFAYKYNVYNMAPQFINRNSSPNDVKTLSLELPCMNTDEDRKRFMEYSNAALIEAKFKCSPVHINCPSYFNYNAKNIALPEDIWTTQYYDVDFENLVTELQNKKIGVFIGSHAKFDKELENLISSFAESYGAAVFCDHTSNYHGKNKILISQISTMNNKKHRPEIIIDIGYICGDYNNFRLFTEAEVWRISEDGSYKCRLDCHLAKLFNCKEKEFFRTLRDNSENKGTYYKEVAKIVDNYKMPDIELSNPLICYELSKKIPNNSSLHLAILNSLRSMNYFKLNESIDVNSNVGGFGIDGPVSTLIGQSLAMPNKLHFGVIGDLAFFYDMNILGQRDIGKNVRIIVVNNNKGVEFRLNPRLESTIADGTDKFIAASGHYKGGLKAWVESCGFHYMYADTKESMSANMTDFCNLDSDKPIIFEIKTTNAAEQKANATMLTYNK